MSGRRAEKQMASIHVQLHLLVGPYPPWEAASHALMTSSVKWGNQQHLQHRAGERISENWDGDPGRPTPALHRNVQQRVSHQISQSSSNHAVTVRWGKQQAFPYTSCTHWASVRQAGVWGARRNVALQKKTRWGGEKQVKGEGVIQP